MKQIAILMFFLVLGSRAYSQNTETRSSFNTFSINGGIAFFEPKAYGGQFPGASLTMGNYIDLSKNNFLQLEYGVAFPSLLTGKIGYLRKTGRSFWGLGIRLLPTTIGPQFLLAVDERTSLGVSAEVNPFNESVGYESNFQFLPELLWLTDFSIKYRIVGD